MDFGEQTFNELLKQAVVYEDGDLIFAEGTAGGWVYVVAFGEVEIFRIIGSKKVILDRVGQGECLGEVSFFDQSVRSASARAIGRVGLMQFKNDVLTREYEKLPHFLKVLLEAVSMRFRSQLNRMTALLSHPKIYAILQEEVKASSSRK